MAKYKLNDIAPIKQGVVLAEDKYWLLNLDMVESNTGKIIDYLYVPKEEIGASTVTFDTDNVLYSKLRPYLNKVVLPDRPGYATSEMLPMRPNTDIITREYLTYFLRSPHFVSYINEKTSGAKMPRANSSDLKAVEIECPTIDEQKRITAIFDEVISIIQLRKKELSKLDDLIKARFVEMFYGKRYPVVKWNNVFNTTTGKLDSNAAVDDGVYPFFTCSKEALSIDKYAFDQEALLLAGNNAAGKYDVKYYNGKFNAYQRTYVLGLKENWSYRLFQYQLEDKLVYLQQQSLGGLTKYLTLKILGKLDFIIPPMDKQKEFEQFVDQVDKSKVAIQAALDKSQLLFDSLMQKYFG